MVHRGKRYAFPECNSLRLHVCKEAEDFKEVFFPLTGSTLGTMPTVETLEVNPLPSEDVDATKLAQERKALSPAVFSLQ